MQSLVLILISSGIKYNYTESRKSVDVRQYITVKKTLYWIDIRELIRCYKTSVWTDFGRVRIRTEIGQ